MHYLLFHPSPIEIFGLFWYVTQILLIFTQLLTDTAYRNVPRRAWGKSAFASVVKGKF